MTASKEMSKAVASRSDTAVAIRSDAKVLVKKRLQIKISDEQRHHMIEEAAYYQSMQDNQNLGPLGNWLAAELQIEKMLAIAKQKH